MTLSELARVIVGQLGPGYHARHDYRFVVPTTAGVVERTATSAIFSSPVASLHTSLVGLTEDIEPENPILGEFAYLGAPFLINRSDSSLSVYRFRGTPEAELITTIPAEGATTSTWVREYLPKELESAQLSLALGSSRELLVESAQAALSSRVAALTQLIVKERHLSITRAFQLSMAVIRAASFGTWDQTGEILDYLMQVSERFSGELSFANIPPEAIAELYERFAVDDGARKRRGVVYTPAWLARYVTSRLGTDSFRTGTAVDPACGSGTFLVCYLERYAEEQGRLGAQISTHGLRSVVAGYDIDPVAIEAARLSLDFFCRSVGVESPTWRLETVDSTTGHIEGEWVIGNLPFGYRTHDGKADVSAVILEHLIATNERMRALALILPDSFAYSKTATRARELLRKEFSVQELTRLPESTFAESSVQTLVLSAKRGTPRLEVLLRDVRPRELNSFRAGSYISKTFVARLPKDTRDPWRLSPFSHELSRAEQSGATLGQLARIHVGSQVYGTDDAIGHGNVDQHSRPILADPQLFSTWSPKSLLQVPTLVADPDDIRRRGPVELFALPKVIVRSTTFIGSVERLAAIPDTQGVWFTDKFTGIWPHDDRLTIQALAAYLQTDFVQVWYATNNPSRKLRIASLKQLPIPNIPAEWWLRAKGLAKPNRVVRPPSVNDDLDLGLSQGPSPEWQWFNLAVNTALGIDPPAGAALSAWLREQQSHGLLSA